MALRPWFEENPERLAYELYELEQRGLVPIVDEALRSRGTIAFDLSVAVHGKPTALRVSYPPGFPHMAPVLSAPETLIDRHQAPVARALCVLGAQRQWRGHYSAGSLIGEAVELLEAALHDRERLTREEVDAPEPASYYLVYEKNRAVVVPVEMQRLDLYGGRWGEFRLLVPTAGPPLLSQVSFFGAGAPPPIDGPAHLAELWSQQNSREWTGTWYWLDEHPPYGAYGDITPRSQYGSLMSTLGDAFPELHRQITTRSKADRGRLFAAVYPDESGARGQFIAGWLTVWTDSVLPPSVIRFHRPIYWPDEKNLQGTAAFGRLRGVRVLLVGAGTLGGTAAVEIARAGAGHVTVVDADWVSAVNLVRHEAEYTDLGTTKARAIGRQIRLHAPWTDVEIADDRVGGLDDFQPALSWDSFEAFVRRLADADLIIDTTGDGQTTSLLNSLAVRHGVPLVVGWSSGGAWGGRIFRVIPGETACYVCLGWNLQDQPDQPTPPGDERAVRFPQGCAHPSFPAAGFETKTVALAITRFAIATLLRSSDYPDFSADHYILGFRDEHGHREQTWLAIQGSRSDRCMICGTSVDGTDTKMETSNKELSATA